MIGDRTPEPRQMSEPHYGFPTEEKYDVEWPEDPLVTECLELISELEEAQNNG